MRFTRGRSHLIGEESGTGPFPSLTVLRVWWLLLARCDFDQAPDQNGVKPQVAGCSPLIGATYGLTRAMPTQAMRAPKNKT